MDRPHSVKVTIDGIEVLHMMRKGQVVNEFHPGLRQFNFIKNIVDITV